jgi:hypothetical protein
MPTNEKLLDGGICPRCEWHLIQEGHFASQTPNTRMGKCLRCGYIGRNGDFITLDDLAQSFANLKEKEFELFKAKVAFCAEARRRGPEAVKALCGYLSYTPQSVKRLGQLHDLPEYLLDPQLPPGVYWAAMKLAADGDDLDMEKFMAMIEKAIVNQWSLAEFKEYHGIVTPDRRQPVYDGVAELVRADGDQWEDVEVKVY